MPEVRRVTLAQVTDAIRERVPFDCNGTLTGKYLSNTPADYGRLDTDEAMALRALIITSAPKPVYVVYSYATPVAWVDPDTNETHKVSQRFSVTTTKHMGKIPN